MNFLFSLVTSRVRMVFIRAFCVTTTLQDCNFNAFFDVMRLDFVNIMIKFLVSVRLCCKYWFLLILFMLWCRVRLFLYLFACGFYCFKVFDFCIPTCVLLMLACDHLVYRLTLALFLFWLIVFALFSIQFIGKSNLSNICQYGCQPTNILLALICWVYVVYIRLGKGCYFFFFFLTIFLLYLHSD